VLGLLDLVSRDTTSSDTVDFSYVSAQTNTASTVAEGSAAPEGALTFAEGSVKVEAVEVSLPLSKKAASDVPRLRTILDLVVRNWVRAKLESQLLVGTGAGGQLLGLANVTGIQTETGGATTEERARLALARSQSAGGGPPTAFLCSPSTYYEDLAGPNDAVEGGPPVYHRKRVVLSSGVPAGTVWVAPWSQATYYARAESVSASNQHKDFYIRNLVLVLAEVRGALAVHFPMAFIKFAVV
jgi:HK97 family phage major capsid protein